MKRYYAVFDTNVFPKSPIVVTPAEMLQIIQQN